MKILNIYEMNHIDFALGIVYKSCTYSEMLLIYDFHNWNYEHFNMKKYYFELQNTYTMIFLCYALLMVANQ